MVVQLRYFDVRGVAETVRYLQAAALAIAGVQYEDTRYSLTFGVPGDFSTIKRPEFDADKAAGKMVIGLGKVPILEVDGFMIPQSKAIERYVARAYGLMGANDLEAALIDSFVEHLRDIKDMYQKARTTDEGKAQFFDKTLGEMFAKFEDAIPAGSGPFFFGDKPSYADVAWFVFAFEYFDDKEKVDAVLTPKIKAAVDAVAALPQVQTWQTTRPKTPF